MNLTAARVAEAMTWLRRAQLLLLAGIAYVTVFHSATFGVHRSAPDWVFYVIAQQITVLLMVGFAKHALSRENDDEED